MPILRDATENLPADADALWTLLLSTMAERDELVIERNALTAERDALLGQVERQQHLLAKLNRLRFGGKSERLPEDQRQLALEDLEQAVAKGDAEAEKHDPELRRKRTAKRRASRGALPAHLPRIDVMLAPEDTSCPCCRAAMTVIGEDSSERLDVIPAQYRVIVTHRPKFACRACEGIVVQSPAPPRLIEGGIPTEALVADVVVARYADHQPLYRQAQMMARQGVLVDRSTLSFWTGYAAAEVAPVVERLREVVLRSTRIFADETVVPVLDPGRGRTKKGYFWAIARDDRPWGGCDPPAVVYTYFPGRAHQHATALLGDYRGILQCDGYGAYKQLVGSMGDLASVTLAFCWSHVRRAFYDLAKAGAPIATETLSRIAALYEIEVGIRGESTEHRLTVRQTQSRPLVKNLHAWFEAQLAKLPSRSPTAEAIRYALKHWDGLERFLEDGRVELDTNCVERAMRPIALSRKNSLFAGSDEGGVNWASLASLIETCKLNLVNPVVYFTDVLTRLVNGWPQSRIDELMPWVWTPAHRPSEDL
jgi:transposase